MTQTSTSERVLFHIKTHGQSTAQQIAKKFEITPMGAHKILQGLTEAGLVRYNDIAAGRGRPRRYFSLTKNGHARFPDRHAEITVDLISHVKNLFGDSGMDKLIAAREAQQLERYTDKSKKSLKQRVEYLAAMRSDEGYMARVEKGENGELLLIEDHCPICAAAKACQGFCRSELAIFQIILGPEVHISRTEHILSNDRRCAYIIRASEMA